MVLVIMDADDGHVIERWVFEPKINALDTKYVTLSPTLRTPTLTHPPRPLHK